MVAKKSSEAFPAWLQKTHRLIAEGFPNGVPDEIYKPLLTLLSENMSQRGLAEVMAFCTGRNYEAVYNDVLALEAPNAAGRPDKAAIEKVKKTLIPCGYDEWVKET